MRRSAPLACAVVGLMLLAAATAASAATYPDKPVRIVVTAAPGGGNDFVTRVIAARLYESLGQTIVVDNRGGAGGLVGTELVAQAAPDGYTLLMAFANLAVYPSLSRKVNFDPARDFAPVSTVAATALVLVVHPALPVKTVKELIAYANSRSAQINFASTGAGSLGHLAAELFKATTHAAMTHVPYKGGGPAITALLGAEIQVFFSTLPAALPLVKNGRLRALAVSSARRTASEPGLPTIAEAGVPGYDVTGWFGLLAPARTTKAVVDRLNSAVNAALQLATVRERLAAEGVDPLGGTPAEFSQLIGTEVAKWSALVKAAGIKPE